MKTQLSIAIRLLYFEKRTLPIFSCSFPEPNSWENHIRILRAEFLNLNVDPNGDF